MRNSDVMAQFRNCTGKRVVIAEQAVGMDVPRRGVYLVLECAGNSTMVRLAEDNHFAKPFWVNPIDRGMKIEDVLGTATVTISNGNPGSWYQDRVGESFEVIKLPSGMWQLLDSPLCINPKDADVVPGV